MRLEKINSPKKLSMHQAMVIAAGALNFEGRATTTKLTKFTRGRLGIVLAPRVARYFLKAAKREKEAAVAKEEIKKEAAKREKEAAVAKEEIQKKAKISSRRRIADRRQAHCYSCSVF